MPHYAAYRLVEAVGEYPSNIGAVNSPVDSPVQSVVQPVDGIIKKFTQNSFTSSPTINSTLGMLSFHGICYCISTQKHSIKLIADSLFTPSALVFCATPTTTLVSLLRNFLIIILLKNSFSGT